MPAYAFEIRWDRGEKLSWTYLPTDDCARRFARFLADDFKGSNQYRVSAILTVKNSDGIVIASIQF